MNPQIRHVQRACEAAKARQAVTVFIDEAGQFAVASYGETKENMEQRTRVRATDRMGSKS